MAETITVRSTLPGRPDGGHPIALYEAHADHPGGEAYVAGPAPVEVARTPAVQKLLADGTLERVKASDDDDGSPKRRSGRSSSGAELAGGSGG